VKMKTRSAVATGLVLGLGFVGSLAQAAPGYAAGEPSLPPVVSTEQAVGVTQNGATLTATVNTEGSETVYEFDLGTDTSYGTRLFGDAGFEPGAQTFMFALQGLAPGATYHYRILATNAAGTVYGADQTFTTSTYPSASLAPPATPALVPAPVLETATARAEVTAAEVAKAKPAARSVRRAKGARTDGKRAGSERRADASGRVHRANRKGRR
jgi:hypothetical protein